MTTIEKTKPSNESNEPMNATIPVNHRLSTEEKRAGRASVYENLTIVRDEYRRFPRFI